MRPLTQLGTRFVRITAVAVAALLGVLLVPGIAAAASFTVNSTDDVDNGPCDAVHCSLREALRLANSSSGTDTIGFNIPGSPPHSIRPLVDLPTVTDSVIIDGTTEPDYAGTPVVELDGSLSAGPQGYGLRFISGNNTVRGLVINSFRFDGVQLAGSAGNSRLEGNFIGTDVTGNVAAGNNNIGIRITSPNNTIGGTSASARNVISSNHTGIAIEAGQTAVFGNIVQGNYIGTNRTGTAALGNRTLGVDINQSNNNTIGGLPVGAANLISANNGSNVRVVVGATGNIVRGNFIGTTVSGTAPLGNQNSGVLTLNAVSTLIADNVVGGITSPSGAGILVSGSSNRVEGNFVGVARDGTTALGNVGRGVEVSAAGSSVGGTGAGQGNVIAFNGQQGVIVFSGVNNGILSNSIHSNGALGIDLFPFGVQPNDPGDADTGPNNFQNYPVLSTVQRGGSSTTVQGTLNSRPNTTYRIEIFSNRVCDPSGFGEGERFLGAVSVTTDSGGNATFTANVAAAPSNHTAVTSTATDPLNNTSEFSNCSTVPARPEAATVTLSPLADTNPVGTSHTVTATARDSSGQAVAGVTILFTVTGSSSASGQCTTVANGQCDFTYTGPQQPGQDVIRGCADNDSDGSSEPGEPCGEASKTWAAGPPATLTLSPATATNTVGTSHTVTATVRDAFTNPVPSVVVRLTVTGSVNTSGQCTTDTGGQCSVTYPGPELPGADVITAFADTDNDGTQDPGEPQGGATKTWVLPVSTPCEVRITNGGWIIANNGDRGSFGGNAQAVDEDTVSGHETYQDHGPAQPFTLQSIRLLAVTCTVDQTQATIFGEATVDGTGSFLFRIDVRDLAEPGRGADHYRILVSTGYDSGDHILEGGNVQIHKN